jgi:hypothetical protein
MKLFGGKFGNTQTWSSTIQQGNLQTMYKENGAKNNAFIKAPFEIVVHFSFDRMREPQKIHLQSTRVQTFSYPIFGFLLDWKLNFCGVLTCSWFLILYLNCDWTFCFAVLNKHLKKL